MIGGGKMWATEYVLNKSGKSNNASGSVNFTSNSVVFTVTNSSSKKYDDYSSTEYTKFGGTTHTISGIPSNERVISVEFEGYANSDSGTSYFTDFNGTSYTSSTTPHTFGNRKSDATSYTFSGLQIESGSFTFGVNSETDLIITITTETKPLMFSASGVSVALSSVDVDNHVASLLPTLTDNRGSGAAALTYSSSNTSVAVYYGSDNATLGNLRLKNSGETTITASDGTNSTSFTLTVTADNVAGTYDATSNTYTFNTAGKATPSVISDVDYCTMTIGNGSEMRVVVPNSSTPAVKVIDSNGFSHPYPWGATDIPQGGTFFKFEITKTGTLTVTGAISPSSKLINSSGTEVSGWSANGTTGSVSGLAAGTYYLRTTDATLMLHSFCFDTGEFKGEYTYTTTTMDVERPNKGIYTFTRAGTLEGGTVIDDVPGLTVTFGNGTYTVSDVQTGNSSRYNGIAVDTGDDITFTPSVNGFLSLKGNFYQNNCRLESTNGNIVIAESSAAYYKDLTELSTPLLAGVTYTLKKGNWNSNLAAFAFRPAFLDPSTLATEVTTFNAYMSTPNDGYPKLITEASQGENVRWSESTRSVMLYNNNNVEILKAGTNLVVRGRVYSGDNDLNAYYLLNANVLLVESTSVADQAYVDAASNYAYTITFNEDIAWTSSDAAVTVESDANTTPSITKSISGNTLTVTFATLEEGATYKVKIAAAGLQKSGDANDVNAAIAYSFSVNTLQEPNISMIFPTKLANVSDPIVLQTDLEGANNAQVNIDGDFPVTGVLSVNGTEVMTLTAQASTNRLIFRPTSALQNNTTYTLTLPLESKTLKELNSSQETVDCSVVMNKNDYDTDGTNTVSRIRRITHVKTFTFTTGTASGTNPYVTATTPTDMTVDVDVDDASHTVTVTFDQAVELVPYATIRVTPVNGSENTTEAAIQLEGESSEITASGSTITFTTTKEEWIKYDLWHKCVIPANTVVGTGGKPNVAYSFRFKAEKKASSNATNAQMNFSTYPQTWNFTNIGTLSTTKTDLATATETASKTRWKKDGTDWYQYNASVNLPFMQGEEVQIFSTDGNSSTVIPEFAGLRFSMTTYRHNGFRIATNGSSFRMQGNTHYMTVPNVPVGKLYIKAKTSERFAINSENAEFASATYASADEDGKLKIGSTDNQTHVYVVNVTEAGDVSFCLANTTFYVIAVSEYSKPVSSVGYATNAEDYAVDYNMTTTLEQGEITALYASGYSNNSVTLTPATNNVVPAQTGVVVKASANSGGYPLFKADMNTTVTNPTTNYLMPVTEGILEDKGVSTVDLVQSENSSYNYVLANSYIRVQEEDLVDKEVIGTGTGLGFYLVSTLSQYQPHVAAHASYMQLPERVLLKSSSVTESSSAGAKSFIPFIIDETGEATGINEMTRVNVQDGDAYYNMSGVRVTNPSKGIYIRGGKKIVIK